MSASPSRVCTKILDGWRISQRLRDKVGGGNALSMKISYKTQRLYQTVHKRPSLAVVRVGESLEMERYVYAKRQLAFSLGVDFYDYIKTYRQSSSSNALPNSTGSPKSMGLLFSSRYQVRVQSGYE